MRLFVAWELPPDLRRALDARLDEVRPRVAPARWLDAARIHLTLSFLGELEAEPRRRLEAGLPAVFALHSVFTVHLRGAGVFPPRGRARVAWIGVDGGEALTRLQLDVSGSCDRILDRPPESRPFRPHLTVARCRRPWSRRESERFRAEGAGPWGGPARLTAGTLFRSHLEPSGARYEALACFPLTAGEPEGTAAGDRL